MKHNLPKNITKVVLGPFAVNCYIFEIDSTLFVIDPGFIEDKLNRQIDKHRFNNIVIINTHSHIDHIGANNFLFERYDIKDLIIHKADADNLVDAEANLSQYMGSEYISREATLKVSDGDSYSGLKFIHTPGHTPGCMMIRFGDILFTGDTLFAGSVGRTDLPGGDSIIMNDTLKNKILTIDNFLLVLPGHGNCSDIVSEKKTNPFLKKLIVLHDQS